MIKCVKTLLGIIDSDQDELLSVIEANTIALFKLITGVDYVPMELEFMVIEVMVKRYNRIGNEGMSQERQADLTQVFEKSDFDEYQALLDKCFELTPQREKGRVVWR